MKGVCRTDEAISAVDGELASLDSDGDHSSVCSVADSIGDPSIVDSSIRCVGLALGTSVFEGTCFHSLILRSC